MSSLTPAGLAQPADDSSPSWLTGGGEMGTLMRSMDWTGTPLGSIESWPQSLRTTVSLCLASRFPTVIYWGKEFICVYNDGYAPILGSKHPWALGRPAREVWSEIWTIIAPMLEGVAATGIATWSEDQLLVLERRGYAEECYFTFSFVPVRAESGGVGGISTTVTETTRQVIGERRLQTLRELAIRTSKTSTVDDACRLAAELFAENPADLPFVLLYLLERDGEHARLAAVTGLPAGLCVSPRVVELAAAAADAAWPLGQVEKLRQPAKVDELERRFGTLPLREGMMAPRSALVLPVGSPGDDRVLGLLVAGISPRLELDEMYRSFLDLVTAHVAAAISSAQALEEATGRAEKLTELDRAKTAFFSNVSHEFRTPLTLMLGPLEDELAEQAMPLPPARRERLRAAHRNSLRLLKLVNTLLDFSRIEAGRLEAHYEPTDLSAYTAELASVFRSAIETAHLTLTVDVSPLPEPVYVDREMWEKIVLNLLSNAFKHTFEGTIRVALRWHGDHAELDVADSGVGIPQAELPRLFDRFHRVIGAKSRTHEGTGIGLALVQELARAHGGDVRVSSREGAGSTFTVTVKSGREHLPPERIGARHSHAPTGPRAAAYVEEALHWISDESTHSGPAPVRFEASDPSGGHRPRILWADDNADMRDYVHRLLAPHYDVTAVADGSAAVAAALAAPPDLVLTDVMMPGLDGFGVLRELRAHDHTRTIPVILLSARAGEEAAVEGLEAGADDYLVKPFTARELLARVRTHLDMAKLRREWASELEQRVRQRTAELAHTTRELVAENAQRKEAEQQLRQTQEAAVQQERLRALGQIASGIAHDINNAISPIALYTESLLEREPNLSDRARDQITTIQRAIEDVAQTVARMREFYRKREPELVLTHVDLNRIVKEVIALTRARWSDVPQQRGVVIDLLTDLSTDLPDTAGAENEIRDALTNLIFNAVDALPEGGRLTLRTFAAQNGDEDVRHACVEVCDTGAGMDAETRSRCLEPFFTTKGERGTGLGLAMVYGMVRRHSADLKVDSELGKGTTMRIIFPAAARLTMSEIRLPELPAPVRSLRILIVDDDPMVIHSLKDALEGDGHLVTTADGGQAGIDTFVAAEKRGESFAVVITDLGMPYVDGCRVATAVRATSPATPIIMLTGWGQRLVTDNAVPPQVDRVLGKPPKLRELRTALAELAN
jgi:signal transduction histidine kinase